MFYDIIVVSKEIGVNNEIKNRKYWKNQTS